MKLSTEKNIQSTGHYKAGPRKCRAAKKNEIENMIAEIHKLKEIMQEFSKSVITLMEEMIHIKIENSERACKIKKRLEEESKNKKEVTRDEVKIKESEVTDEEVVFNCENCKYHSSCEKELKTHMKSHTKKKQMFKCNDCQFTCGGKTT